MDTKETNPKDAIGSHKVPTHNIPCGVIFELGLAMMEGARKYGSHNYRVAKVRASVYYDAIERHVKSWWEGEDIDPDSGIHHLVKAMACETVMRDAQMNGSWVDDRPVRLTGGLDMEKLNQQAAAIMDRYPEVVKPYTQAEVKAEEM